MTREQLERILQSHYEFQCVLLARFIPEHIRDEIDFNGLFEILKDGVFNELIPEVLKEIKPRQHFGFSQYTDGWNKCLEEIKQKAKERINPLTTQ